MFFSDLRHKLFFQNNLLILFWFHFHIFFHNNKNCLLKNRANSVRLCAANWWSECFSYLIVIVVNARSNIIKQINGKIHKLSTLQLSIDNNFSNDFPINPPRPNHRRASLLLSELKSISEALIKIVQSKNKETKWLIEMSWLKLN